LQFENHQYYNCEIELDTAQTYRVAADWLYAQQLDDWLGWHCDAGHSRLSIDPDFEVFSGLCENDSLGNLFGEWQLLPEPTVCTRTRCSGCTDDLLIKKHKFSLKD
jgi:hypothetical protein